ncbi:hypothetical protein AAF712_000707 [Marasmius tenuissimus]|uniref:F-box domain-containing protein n=1 Tax=Marasmius tenuissimus TaxID=585030 RepID=A0ABR3AE75_9AGAR
MTASEVDNDRPVSASVEMARAEAELANMSTPMCRLPTEVLANIFMHCNTNYPVFVEGNRAKGTITLFRLARICRHWREIALNTPELWAQPDFSFGTPLARTMLKRSKDVPLVLDAELDKNTKAVLLEALRDALSRLTVLHLTASDNRADLEEVLRVLTQPAPFLHTLGLDLDFDRWHGAGVRNLQFTEIPLPHAFLGDHSPRLKTLLLRRCYIPLDSPILANVTRLSLDTLMWQPTDAFQLTESLRELAHLEVLEVRNPFPPGQGAVSNSGERVHLPHLRYIRLDEVDSSGAACFLEHMSLPNSPILVVKGRSSLEDPPGELTRFISSLSRTFASQADPKLGAVEPIRSMHVGYYEVYGWIRETLPPEYPFIRPEHTGLPPPDLRVYVGFSTTFTTSSNDSSYLAGLLSTFPSLGHLRSLQIDVTETRASSAELSQEYTSHTIFPSLEDFAACFGGLPCLETVRLKGELAPLLIPVFGSAFDALLAIELKSVLQSRIIPRVGSRIRDIMADVATSRTTNGVGMLKTLNLVQCEGVHASDVGLLEGIIAQVNWDHWEEKEYGFDIQVEDTGESLASPLYRPSIVVQ